jgi:hypothetical protein
MEDRDPLDAMLEGAEATSAPQTEATPAATPEATAEQPRDETGRFAPKAEPQAAGAPAAPEIIAPVQPSAQAKPLIDPEQFKGYLEERDKRQAAEARAAKAEADAKALRERVEQQQAQPIPNYNEDPEGHVAALRQNFERRLLSERFDNSETLARQTHGDDVVQKAMDWGMEKSNASQPFATDYVRQRHPIDWIVKAYKRDQLLSQIGDKDPVEWAKELLAAQSAHPNPQASPASPQSSAPPSATPLPSPSLVSARSAGGLQTGPIGPGVAFDALFPK